MALSACFAFSGALFVPTEALAQGLIISDCQGFTRAVQDVEPNSLSKVEVEVQPPTGEPVDVTLTEVSSGSVQTAQSINGIVVFEGVQPGIYEIATTQTGVALGTVKIQAAALTAAAATSAGLTGGAAVGGGVIGSALVVDETTSSGGGGEDSPSPQPTPPPIPEPDPTPPPDDCAVCDPDAEPTPLEPFEPEPGALALSPYQ